MDVLPGWPTVRENKSASPPRAPDSTQLVSPLESLTPRHRLQRLAKAWDEPIPTERMERLALLKAEGMTDEEVFARLHLCSKELWVFYDRVVEDVKSAFPRKNREYRRTRKLVEALHGITIREVVR